MVLRIDYYVALQNVKLRKDCVKFQILDFLRFLFDKWCSRLQLAAISSPLLGEKYQVKSESNQSISISELARVKST